MKEYRKKDMFFLSLTLFSLFFGAGNLIFPPFLGQEAGKMSMRALSGFLFTAVGFPILAVVVVTKMGGLDVLASKVHPVFSRWYSLLIYLSIGPMLGIPRAASLPFEMVMVPMIGSNITHMWLWRLAFTAIFFILAFRFSIRPHKLIDYLGRMLTPMLLMLLLFVFLTVLKHPIPLENYVRSAYEKTPFVEGFIQGYLTMDTIAALNFGLVISNVLVSQGIDGKDEKVQMSLKAGIRAGLLLTLIYVFLTYLGYMAGSLGIVTEHGAQTLMAVMTVLYGSFGMVLLAIIFTLACLTTSIGLITSISEYFSQKTKYAYGFWVSVFTFFSFVVSNIGLNQILKLSVPILSLLYPVALVLIVLGLGNQRNLSSSVYQYTVLVAIFFSFLKLVDDLIGLKIPFVIDLPLYASGLAWVGPTLLTWLLCKILFQKNEKTDL